MLGRLLNTAAASLNPAAHSSKNYTNQLESVTEEEHTAGLLFPATTATATAAAAAAGNNNTSNITTASNTAASSTTNITSNPNNTSASHRNNNNPLYFNRYSSSSSSTPNAYDDRGRLDPAPFRNFRLVIAQDALGDRDEPCILFDSERHGLNAKKPSLSAAATATASTPTPTSATFAPAAAAAAAPTPAPASATTLRAGGNTLANNHPTIISQRTRSSTLTHSPFNSASTQDTTALRSPSLQPWRKETSDSAPTPTPTPPQPSRPSALFSARRRNSPLLQSAEDPESSKVSSDASLLNCIFGSNAFTYRGSSTKMHILPQNADGSDELDIAALRSSRFRAGSTQSSSSYTHHHGSIPRYAHANPNHNAFLRRESSGNDSRSSHPHEMTVMVTRMFSINLHTDTHTAPETQSPIGPANASLPTGPRETKTPMFAVAITIKLPFPRTSPSGTSTFAPTSGAGSSYKNREFMSASVDSDHKWTSNLFSGINDTLNTTSNMDDRIDMLVEHWDSITRAIACVEKIASKEISTHLEATDIQMRQRMKMHRSPHPRTLVVTLSPNSLSESNQIREEAARATRRIYMALRIPRVVTGQSRWGIWREEARWVSKLLGSSSTSNSNSKGQRLFFPVLMTAFLGNHTEWIQFLGPDWHRRRRFLQHKSQKENEPVIPNRTVIISADKMTSRRLIFVLSSFLPRQQGSEFSLISPPEASVQLLSGSQSPSFPPPTATTTATTTAADHHRPDSARKYSQFRHVNGKGRFTHHFSTSVPSTNLSALAAQAQAQAAAATAGGGPGNAGSNNSHSSTTTKPLERSTSSTLDELWQSSYHNTSYPLRNTASATVAYAAPEASIPVAHFSHESKKRYSNGAGYSSSGNSGGGGGGGGGLGIGSGEFDDESSSSMASENLMRNLRSSSDLLARSAGGSPQEGLGGGGGGARQKASSYHQQQQQQQNQKRHNRWDSLLSGFWSSGSGSSSGNHKSHQASPTTTTAAAATTKKKPATLPSALENDVRRGKDSQRTVTPDKGRGVKQDKDANQQQQSQQESRGDNMAGDITPGSITGDSGKGGEGAAPRDSQDPTESESITSPIKISGCRDGVVDVELPLPGFVSLASSTDSQMIPPYQKIRPSPASPDNCGSFQSNTSAPLYTPSTWKEYDGLNINVAGWLKRFHEDFLLQAVRPYEELEGDIRRTMSAEPTPANILAMMSDHCNDDDADAGADDGDDDDGEVIGLWYDVCTTLIADVKACSVKQLRLQRRMVRRKKKERNNSCYSANSALQQPQTQSPLLAQTTTTAMSPLEPADQQQQQCITEIEEQFIEEPVVEVDDVFIDAVDRVLARNVPTTSASTTTSSTAAAAAATSNRASKGRSASIQSLMLFAGTGGVGGGAGGSGGNAHANRRRSIQPRQGETGGGGAAERADGDNTSISEVPRAECSRLVLGALEEVVRSVTAERYSEDEHGVDDVLLGAGAGAGAAATPNKGLSRKATYQENTLREGIRKWLSEVEETF